ncbi:hypothetical protein CDEST_11492 [Colletotrichum destructivum]|uniref:Uncharacterized protein n=1 Tax=Colletotrichum destructivum TaxID=34406 RepID=A0AAX4ITJ8_9PEZI|nr:hypothetical protein CDEST_11492 [Colletotrichum destructivum]
MLRSSRFLLLFSLLWVAIAHERELHPAPGHSSLRRAVPDEIQYCSLETCGAGDSSDTCRRRLSPRVLQAPDPSSRPAKGHWYGPANYDNSVDSFFRGEIAKRAAAKTDIVTVLGGEVTSEYIRFMDEPKSLAMLGFCGCMGLIVLSRSAVWMAHMYENPVLVNGPEVFQKRGIAVLKKGKRSSDMYYGLSDLRGNVFAPDEKPVAIVFAPKSSSSDFQYEPLMRDIDQMVKKLIGVDPEWVGYKPKRTDDVKSNFDFFCANSKGKVLVQYQPSNKRRSGRSKAKARIWIEGDSWTFKMSWSPHRKQKRY